MDRNDIITAIVVLVGAVIAGVAIGYLMMFIKTAQ